MSSYYNYGNHPSVTNVEMKTDVVSFTKDNYLIMLDRVIHAVQTRINLRNVEIQAWKNDIEARKADLIIYLHEKLAKMIREDHREEWNKYYDGYGNLLPQYRVSRIAKFFGKKQERPDVMSLQDWVANKHGPEELADAVEKELASIKPEDYWSFVKEYGYSQCLEEFGFGFAPKWTTPWAKINNEWVAVQQAYKTANDNVLVSAEANFSIPREEFDKMAAFIREEETAVAELESKI
jgi:hypothetical protein